MKKYKALGTIILVTGLIIISRASETQKITQMVSNLTSKTQQNNQYTICIDPGHQLKGSSQTEQMGPNSASYKLKVSSGTQGISTKKPEYQLNLEASLKLKHILESRGYKVYMTRVTNDVNISNKERAIFANDKNVDMMIRIHADGSDNSSITGASILIPSKTNKCTEKIFSDSSNYAKLLNDKLQSKGFKVNGIFERYDLTGLNWSKVPVVLLEMGFMSNYTEDINMSNSKYQQKMMTCVADGLDDYFKSKELNNQKLR